MNTTAPPVHEPAQIGLLETVHGRLAALVEDGYFLEMRDGYLFGVAYALSKEVNPDRIPGNRRNVFSISTLDQEGLLKVAIDTLYPSSGEAAYRTAERLADWGIPEVDRLLRVEFQSISDLLP